MQDQSVTDLLDAAKEFSTKCERDAYRQMALVELRDVLRSGAVETFRDAMRGKGDFGVLMSNSAHRTAFVLSCCVPAIQQDIERLAAELSVTA